MLANQITPEKVNPSPAELMKWYNKASKAAHQGKLDQERVNRAFGYIQRNERNEYNTSTKACSCPDYLKNHKACKHMIAIMILTRITEERKGAALNEKASSEKLSTKYTVTHTAEDIELAEVYTRKSYILHIFATNEQVSGFQKMFPEVKLQKITPQLGKRVKFDDHRAEIY